jgi:glycosyltransferase involved in cell wall biosynthesis
MSDSVKNLVSVIIPNFNHENYLKKRIDSVINQTYKNIEIIILDDHSTDNSLSIIKQYEKHEKVVKVLINTVNSGSPFKQWKKGLALSHGEFIWIAESDDYNEPEFLSSLLKYHKKYPGVGIAYSNTNVIDNNDNIIDTYRYHSEAYDGKRWNNSFFSTGVDEVVNYFVYKSTIPNVTSVLFKRNSIVDNIDSILDFKYSGDYMLYARILHDSDIYFTAEVLNYSRVHDETTRAFSEKNIKHRMLEEIKVREYISNNFPVCKDVLVNVMKKNVIRKDSYYKDTSNRITRLLNALPPNAMGNTIILTPYNDYTKLICNTLLEHGYEVNCFLDNKNFGFDVYYKEIPVFQFKSLSLKTTKTPLFIIASDRYKKELKNNLQSILDKKIKAYFF